MPDLLTGLGSGGATEIEPPTMPRADKMPEMALVFLDVPLARKLAVAWTTCRGDESIWAAVAGIPNSELAEARVVMESLFANGICRAGGVTDPLALQYITAIVAQPIKRSAKRGR